MKHKSELGRQCSRLPKFSGKRQHLRKVECQMRSEINAKPDTHYNGDHWDEIQSNIPKCHEAKDANIYGYYIYWDPKWCSSFWDEQKRYDNHCATCNRYRWERARQYCIILLRELQLPTLLKDQLLKIQKKNWIEAVLFVLGQPSLNLTESVEVGVEPIFGRPTYAE